MTSQLFHIDSCPRYDINSLVINGNEITNWHEIKTKLNFSQHEINGLITVLKRTFNTQAISGQDRTISFPYDISNHFITLSGIISQYIVRFKLCKVCNLPDVRDGRCYNCITGASGGNQIVIPKKTKLTTQDKIAMKKNKKTDSE